MNVADIIRSTKSAPDLGEWKAGHVNRSSFPLSKAKAKNYKFGSEYKWRLVQFSTLGKKFRVLLLLNENKQICRMTLALDEQGDLQVLCHHEFHASEPGWHCHVSFSQLEKIPPGISRTHLKRWPKPNTEHAKLAFSVDERSALSFAAELFRFSAQGDLL